MTEHEAETVTMTRTEAGATITYRKEPTDEVRLLLEIIQWKRTQYLGMGLEPKRVYMSYRTKRKLHGGLYTPNFVVTVPHGNERRDTIFGLDIYEVADMPDMVADIGCDFKY